jgi:hypothetical protein
MTAAPPLSRRDYALALLLALGNVALKWPFQDQYPLAIDEPISVYLSQFEPRAIFRYLRHDTNVPLYDILLHGWTQVSGRSVFGVRLFSLVLYGLSTGLLFGLGRRFFGRGVALGATLLLVASNAHVHFAQEARCYALFLLLSLAATFQFFVRIERAPQRGTLANWALLALTYLALVYTHYFGWFVVGVHGLSTLLIREARPLHRRFIAVVGLTVLGFAPMAYFALFVFYREVVQDRWWLTAPDTWAEIWSVPQSFLNTSLTAAGALLVLALAYAPPRWRQHPPTAYERVLLLFFPGAFLVMLLFSYAVPMYLDRYQLYTSPALFLLVGTGLRRLLPERWSFAGIALLLGLMGTGYQPVHDRAWNMAATAVHVRSLRQTETVTYLFPRFNDLGFAYYFDSTTFAQGPYSENLRERLRAQRVYAVWTAESADSLRIREAPHVLLVADTDTSTFVATVRRLRRAGPPRVRCFGKLCVYEFGTSPQTARR